MKNLYLFALALFFIPFISNGQCVPGEVAVEFVMSTDDYGYEVYWELVPSGNDCGDGTIAFGGNDIDVGCNGAEQEDAQDENGYESNVSFTEGVFCLDEGESYDLIFVDDFADGGLSVLVYEDGELTNSFTGSGDPTIWTFEIGNPSIPENNVACGASTVEVDSENIFLDNTQAAIAEGEPSPDGGGCNVFGLWCEGSLTNTVWASFIAPESGAVQISTCNEGTNLDTQLALYSADDCSDWESFQLISSGDDILGGCGSGDFYSSECFASCLTPGETYYIQMDGWEGATGTAELSVVSYEGELVLDALIDDVDCPNIKGETTGGIAILAYGTGADYTASWTGPNDFTGSGIGNDDLEAGEYEISIETACGEIASGAFTVGIPDPLEIDASVADATCEASTNGAIAVALDGGTEPYSIEWLGPEGFSSSDLNISELLPGFYTLNVTDDNDCEYVQNVNVDFETDFSFDLGEDQTICEDEELFLSGPAGFIYTWQDGSENQFFIANGEELGLGSFPIVLTVSDGEGCEASDALFLTIEDCTGIDELSRIKINLFPNPVQSNLNIQGLENLSEYRLSIWDMSGKMISSEQKNQHSAGIMSLDLSDLSSGIYLLRVSSGHSHRQVKFTVH